jgi:hypothetical protein
VRRGPYDLVDRTEAISDLYITGTQIRLREARPIDGGGPPMLRLTRKADIIRAHAYSALSTFPENELDAGRCLVRDARHTTLIGWKIRRDRRSRRMKQAPRIDRP